MVLNGIVGKMTNKKSFDKVRKRLKQKVTGWIELLDKKEYDEAALSSITYIAQDNIADESGSYLLLSITSLSSATVNLL